MNKRRNVFLNDAADKLDRNLDFAAASRYLHMHVNNLIDKGNTKVLNLETGRRSGAVNAARLFKTCVWARKHKGIQYAVIRDNTLWILQHDSSKDYRCKDSWAYVPWHTVGKKSKVKVPELIWVD